MFALIGFGLLGLLLVTAIVPWVNRAQIRSLRAEVAALRVNLRDMAAHVDSPGPRSDPPSEPDPTPDPRPEPAPAAQPAPAPQQDGGWDHQPPAAAPAPDQRPKRRWPRAGFELLLGARLPVWVGGIALALAGFFLVKYSIEQNLLTETVRVVLGGLLGLGLLGAGHWVRARPGFANGRRIGQSLSGAGIAVLYLALYAATALYGLISPMLGFMGMAATTAAALGLSLRHDAPIALLGLIGGFITPLLLGTREPATAVLFIYLYLVFAGLMIVVRRQNWWLLSLPTLAGVFLWIGHWMVSGFSPDDTIWIGLFLLAISATIVIASRPGGRAEEQRFGDKIAASDLLNFVGLAGALGLMGLIAGHAGFGATEWSLFGLLAAGGVGLAAFDERRYGFVPLAALAVTAVMLVVWPTVDRGLFTVTLMAFGALFLGAGGWMLWRARWPLLWGALVSATALGFYGVAYGKLVATTDVPGAPYLWGGIALLLAAAVIALLQQVQARFAEGEAKDHLLALFAAVAVAFVSLGLTVELEREFLSVAFAAEALAVAWINSRVRIASLRPIAGILALVFLGLLTPQVLLLVQLTAYSLVEAKLWLQQSVPIVQWPLFQLGLPALFLAAASLLLRRQQDDHLVRALELLVVGLIAVMGYYLTRHAFHVDQDVLFVKAGFLERGVVTNILFLYGLTCFWIGRRFERSALSWSGVVLSAIALFRIAYFDLVVLNPIWAHQEVGAWPLLNGLLLPYGLPILWIWLAGRELGAMGKPKWAAWGGGAQLLLLFALITLNVRQLYHGPTLAWGVTGDGEIYSYSVAWLLLGVGLLFAGTLKKDALLRGASLGVMVLVVGKVFLYDASALDGLWRVFSFFGLGLSLIGLSWFYSRFVFRGGKPALPAGGGGYPGADPSEGETP
ncbi:MAG: DUF2339 domain-containing protein [Pseudomonadota bacterium]